MHFGYQRLYVNGCLTDAFQNRKYPVTCPANGEVVAEVAWAGAEDTKAALTNAQQAVDSWSRAPVHQRCELMHRLKMRVVADQERLRLAEMYENGKTYEQTEEGYQRLVDTLEFYAQAMRQRHGHLITEPDAEHKIVYQGVGVVGAFVAWNFPLLNLAFKLGPALAAGCP